MTRWKWLPPVLVVAAVTVPTIANAQIYKWVDANGNVQFGNAPPQVDAQQINTKIDKPAAGPDNVLPDSELKRDGAVINADSLLGAWSSSKPDERSDWTFRAGGRFEGSMADSLGKVAKVGTYKIIGNKIVINTTNKIDDALGKRTLSGSEEFEVISLNGDTLIIEIDSKGFVTKPAPYTFKRKY